VAAHDHALYSTHARWMVQKALLWSGLLPRFACSHPPATLPPLSVIGTRWSMQLSDMCRGTRTSVGCGGSVRDWRRRRRRRSRQTPLCLDEPYARHVTSAVW